ncbi:MAG: NUDIX hydrolase [Candidatus Methanomethyliaceae archaeon]|nr:NUDIX hydrolase [Candidatus Methanomethyliaceae archaeon]MDW7970579.1 NUDIX hydrolase [Nitrososphaerota archaeon]
MREYPDRPIIGAGILVIDNGKVLLIKRGNDPNKGLWSIPGGMVRLGESPEEAAIREFKEETGLDAIIEDLLGVFNVVIRDDKGKIKYHYVVIDYLGKVIGGMLKPGSDVLDAKWFEINELSKIQTSATLKKAIELVMKIRNENKK